MNPLELPTQRRLTKAFIDTMPVTITLTPRLQERKASGGYTWAEQAPRVPQVLRLVEPSGAPQIVTTADGKERLIEFLLIGQHDAEIGVYDIFTHEGLDYEVLSLYHFNGWERRAQVARRG